MISLKVRLPPAKASCYRPRNEPRNCIKLKRNKVKRIKTHTLKYTVRREKRQLGGEKTDICKCGKELISMIYKWHLQFDDSKVAKEFEKIFFQRRHPNGQQTCEKSAQIHNS